MNVISLPLGQAQDVARALNGATWEVLVAYDPIDQAFKVKIDGGAWSPPLGTPHE